MITVCFYLIYYYRVRMLFGDFVRCSYNLLFVFNLTLVFDCYTPHLITQYNKMEICPKRKKNQNCCIHYHFIGNKFMNSHRLNLNIICLRYLFAYQFFIFYSHYLYIYQSDYTKFNILSMNKEPQMHRNKCQGCFKAVGRFILDCYCILCEVCFSIKAKNTTQCQYCWKPTKGNFIDVKNENSVNKMSYLFGNIETSIMKCLEIYKFQVNIDLRYCKFLENQIERYKDAIGELVQVNPPLAGYFDAKLANKGKNQYKSVSERISNQPSQMQNQNRYQAANNSSLPPNTPRSLSTSNIQMHHEQLVDPHRVNVLGGDRNYSGKMVNYKVPNINYNTAMRSSKRPPHNKHEDDNGYYRERR